jgi:hypothetical protein
MLATGKSSTTGDAANNSYILRNSATASRFASNWAAGPGAPSPAGTAWKRNQAQDGCANGRPKLRPASLF